MTGALAAILHLVSPYLIRSGAAPRPVTAPGSRLPLGVRAEVPYQSATVSLAPGDSLLLLTDGAPESRLPDGTPLGYARFAVRQTIARRVPATSSNSQR